MTGPADFAPVTVDVADGILARHTRWVAEQVVAAENAAAEAATVRAVWETLNQVAGWINRGDDKELLRVVAYMLQRGDWRNPADAASATCPLCGAAVCVEGCALTRVRAAAEPTRPVEVTGDPAEHREVLRRMLLHGDAYFTMTDDPAPTADPT